MLVLSFNLNDIHTIHTLSKKKVLSDIEWHVLGTRHKETWFWKSRVDIVLYLVHYDTLCKMR